MTNIPEKNQKNPMNYSIMKYVHWKYFIALTDKLNCNNSENTFVINSSKIMLGNK